MSHSNLPVLGIDFGTTFSSAAAVVEGGQVQFAKSDSNRSYAEPTVIYKQDTGLIVGAVADNLSMLEPGKSCRHFKRIITEDTPIYLGDDSYQVTDLVTATLAHMRSISERLIGGLASDAVITHPATYPTFIIDKLRSSAYNAGFDYVELIPEPVAAAHSFFHDKLLTGKLQDFKVGDKLAVYDLGGGTFDASLYEIKYDGSYEILHEVVGDDRCGGIDFDRALLRYVLEQCGGVLDPIFDGQSSAPKVLRTRQYINEEIIRIKHSLSVVEKDYFIPSSAIDCPDILVTRVQYEELIKPFVNRTVDLLKSLLSNAGVQTNQLAGVILIGGSSRTPLVTQLVASELNTRTLQVPDPDLAVCRGAALYGYRNVLTRGVRTGPSGRRVTLSPDDAEAQIKLGVDAYSKRKFSEAKQYFYAVYDSYPNDIRALAGIVSCLLGIGDHVEALSLSTTANKLAPRNKEIAALVVRAHIAGKDFTQAKKFGFDYIQGYGSSPELTKLLEEMGESDPLGSEPTGAAECNRCNGTGKVPNLFGDDLLACPECTNKEPSNGDQWRMELSNHSDSIVFLEFQYSGTLLSGTWYGTAGEGHIEGVFEPRKLIKFTLVSADRSTKLVGDHFGGTFSGRWRDGNDARKFGEFRLRKDGPGTSPLLSERVVTESPSGSQPPPKPPRTGPAPSGGSKPSVPPTPGFAPPGPRITPGKPPVIGPTVVTEHPSGTQPLPKPPRTGPAPSGGSKPSVPPTLGFPPPGPRTTSGKPPVIGPTVSSGPDQPDTRRTPPIVKNNPITTKSNLVNGIVRQRDIAPWNGDTDVSDTVTYFKFEKVKIVVYCSMQLESDSQVSLQIRMNSTKIAVFDSAHESVCRFTAMSGRMLLGLRLIDTITNELLVSNTYCLELGDRDEVITHAAVIVQSGNCTINLEHCIVD